MDRRSLLARALSLGTVAHMRMPRAATRSRPKRLAALLFDRSELWEFLPPELGAALHSLGWAEGTNLSIEWRYANGDAALLASHAVQIVSSAPDAILTRGTQATRALQQATKTIAIVTGVGDPIGSGFAKAYARPGSNITGVSYATPETNEKHLELLRLMVPKLTLLHIVIPDSTPDVFRSIESIARVAGLETRHSVVTKVADLQRALHTNNRPGEVAAMIFNLSSIEPEAVAGAALAEKMPTIFQARGYVDAGGLASYRLHWTNQIQRTAAQIDKIFRGEDPGQVPFELPTVSEFVLNRKTARLLGVALPRSLLMRANSIVE